MPFILKFSIQPDFNIHVSYNKNSTAIFSSYIQGRVIKKLQLKVNSL